jgi:hypothetical protein
VLQVLQEQLELRAQRVLLDKQVLQVLLARQVLQEQLELQAQRVPQV